MNGCRVKAGDGSGVDGGLCDAAGEVRRNGDFVWPANDIDDAAPSSVTAENHSMNNDYNDHRSLDSGQRESVWLEYLYAWNPLAAGNAAVRQSSD